MQSATAAGSFMNSLLRRAIPHFQSLGRFRFEHRSLPFREGRPARLDLLVEADDGRCVMIALQAREEDCLDGQALLSAASGLQVQLFRGRESGGDRPEEEEDAEDAIEDTEEDKFRIRATQDIYVIHIADCHLREARQDAVSVETMDGIHLIQIELPRIDIRFPVAAEVALGWNELDWWFYLLKFSGRFSHEELGRCRGLGIPDGVINGFAQLWRQRWTEKQRASYLDEVVADELLFEPVGRMRPARDKRKTLREHLRSLVRVFLDTGSLESGPAQGIGEGFSMLFLREIWDIARHRNKSEAMYISFINALEQQGLLRC
jgi:hypothetical protein